MLRKTDAGTLPVGSGAGTLPVTDLDGPEWPKLRALEGLIGRQMDQPAVRTQDSWPPWNDPRPVASTSLGRNQSRGAAAVVLGPTFSNHNY